MAGTDTPGERPWTTGQVAAYLRDLGITRRQVYLMIEDGSLPAVRRGRNKWARVPPDAVRALRQELLGQLDRSGAADAS